MGRFVITPTSISTNGHTWPLSTAGEPQWSARVGRIVATHAHWEDGQRGAGPALHRALRAATARERTEAGAYLDTDLHNLLHELDTYA